MLKIKACLILGFMFLISGYFPVFAGSVVIGNSHFRYEITRDGKNQHFIGMKTGKDYLYADTVSYCATVTQGGTIIHATSASLRNNHLSLEFGNSGVKVGINIENGEDHITLEVADIQGNFESLTFLNIPLTLKGMPDEPFAACALSLNLYTRVIQLPALQTQLRATCYQRFGIKGGKAALIGVDQQDILPAIRHVMEQAKEVPHSTAGGAWAGMNKEGYGSYLMNFGTLTEATVPDWIEMCKNLGFNQIDNHGGGNFFKFGDFELNPEIWPEGWIQFKRINDRLHEAGISTIFHTYAFFIDKNSKYVTPVPSRDLGYFSSFTLAKPVGPDENEIEVKESTANVSLITGFFVRNSVTLRIGDELVSFSGITSNPPYKFTGCRRGENGTKKSSHTVQDTVYHLREMFGRFVPGPETPLFLEIAHHTAEIVNKCGFNGLYFDAIDGSDILAGEDNAWYYGTRFIFEVVKNLDHPVSMEMSSMYHHWWHFRSRWQAWDRPVRGYKRFIDIHAAAIKTEEHEHGLWRGYTPLINQYAPAENGGLLLPLHLGWWGNQTWNPPQVEPTFPDDIEYLCCKMIGNNAGLSMLGGADKKTLDENPLFRRLIPIIRQYEELRHGNYFSDSIRSLLRQPGKEFTLFRENDGKWNFKPVTYQKHKIEGLNVSPAKWTVNNEFGMQPVRMRIELLMSVKPYNDQENVVLADFSETNSFSGKGSAGGVTGKLEISDEKVPGGIPAATFSAFSAGTSPREGSWIQMERKFDPLLDIEKNQALGVWVKGDGNGELLNLRTGNPKHISEGARGDHFIKIDFTGWKYFELVETESSEFSNYIWPEKGFYVYDSYRHTVNFKYVDKLQLWYNNLPPGKEVSCRVSAIKALPMVPVTVSNPAVIINGETIVFPVTMESGMYLEFNSVSDCRLYGPKGELLKEITIPTKVPTLQKGNNNLSFRCEGPDQVNPRFQVTIISEGDPLISH